MKNIIIIIVVLVLVGGGIWFLSTMMPGPEEPVMPEEVAKEAVTEKEEEEVINGEEKINILYPSGGEEWVIGEIYNIQWESQSIDRVDIYIYTGGFADCRTVYRLATNISADLGEYSFTVPSDMCPYEIDPSGRGYTIQFWHPDTFDIPDTGFEHQLINLVQESNHISIIQQ